MLSMGAVVVVGVVGDMAGGLAWLLSPVTCHQDQQSGQSWTAKKADRSNRSRKMQEVLNCAAQEALVDDSSGGGPRKEGGLRSDD